MSLRGREFSDSPDYNSYVARDLIPEAERCESCEGMGTVRYRYSQTGRDWQTCLECDGTGRKLR